MLTAPASSLLVAAFASLPTELPLTSWAVLPAMIDCQPALSARIPVSSPLAFSIATVPAQIITSLPIVLTTLFSTSWRFGLITIGMNIRKTLIEITVANTENA